MLLAIDQGTTGTEVAETTAFGAALPARDEPRISDAERESLLDGRHRAIERSRGWAREG
jgi:hypothetical protein